MTGPISESHPLRRLFAGLVENALYADLGMCEPAVASYLAGLLTEFVHLDRIHALRSKQGRPLEDVAEMLADAYLGPNMKGQRRDRIVHKHIGDYTLFWSGVYPETLRRLGPLTREDRLKAYLEQGKRSYAIASELSGKETNPPAAVFRRLSENFESCVAGLGLVRRSWEQTRPRPFPGT